jgi:hypothetical protein
VYETCIHCNMCNNARLETRKIGLHFCGTSPYTREPHQLLFTGAEPEWLISHHQGRAVPVRLTELCRSNDINNKKLIRYIDWWTTWHHICVLVIVCSVVECYSCWFCGITAIDRWVGASRSGYWTLVRVSHCLDQIYIKDIYSLLTYIKFHCGFSSSFLFVISFIGCLK